MAQLQTRKPTGRIQYPLVLVEGEDKGGKSYALAQFASSPRVGRVFYLDIGDGTLDEYAALGDYELLVHDGTWSSIIGQVEAACEVPSDPDRPNVVGVDGGHIVWALLKSWTDARARSSRKNQAILKDDPDAEIDPSMNLWNDAKDRWAQLMRALKMFPGIGVITAVGREVTKVKDGVPVAGQTEWSVDVEKTTTGWASAWVRMRRPHKASLIGIRKLEMEILDQAIALPDEHMLHHLVFEVLGAGGFGAATAVQPEVGVPVGEAKARLLDAITRANPSLTESEVKDEARRLWAERGMGPGPDVQRERLTSLLVDVAEGNAGVAPPKEPEPDPGPVPESDGTHIDGDLLDAAIAEVSGFDVTTVKASLVARGLPRVGSHDDLRARLASALYEERKPFENGEGPGRPDHEAGEARFEGAQEPQEATEGAGTGEGAPEGDSGAQTGVQTERV